MTVVDESKIATPLDWAKALLTRLGAPINDTTTEDITAWETAEGTFAKGWRNPLDTTQRTASSTSANSVGVQRYPTWGEGLDATVKTLRNGRYPTILSDLGAGNVNVDDFAADVRGTAWGSSTFFPHGRSHPGVTGSATGAPAPTPPASSGAQNASNGTAATGDTAGIDLNPLNWLSDIFGGATKDIGKALLGVGMTVTFVGAGLAMVVIGVMKAADPSTSVTGTLRSAAGKAGDVAAAGAMA